jgi:hypothetical protein
MNTREYHELFRYLMEKVCLLEEDIVYVDNIAEWCRDMGIVEPDREKPVKLISKDGQGCKMLIKEDITYEVIEERINAMRIRGQLKNIAFDRADMLNSDHKKLAYLFLSEYALSLPDIGDDELLADDWAFGEMEKLGYFKK